MKIINSKKKLLLHVCCAPCSSSVLEKLKSDFDIVFYWYNPNIFPTEEYGKRLEDVKRFADLTNTPLAIGRYDPDEWNSFIAGYEKEKEGGARCYKCIEFRIKNACKYALSKNFDLLATTLSVSPHKNTGMINQIGQNIAGNVFLVEDFKKKDGYKKSVELSKKYDLYRQNYCGCKFSL